MSSVGFKGAVRQKSKPDRVFVFPASLPSAPRSPVIISWSVMAVSGSVSIKSGSISSENSGGNRVGRWKYQQRSAITEVEGEESVMEADSLMASAVVLQAIWRNRQATNRQHEFPQDSGVRENVRIFPPLLRKLTCIYFSHSLGLFSRSQ